MKVTGNEYCPDCGKKNKLHVLFSSSAYDECNCKNKNTTSSYNKDLILKNITGGSGVVIVDGNQEFCGSWDQATREYIKLYNKKHNTDFDSEKDGQWVSKLDDDGNPIWYIEKKSGPYWT